MAWRRIGDKPLFEQMMAYFNDAYYATSGLNELINNPWEEIVYFCRFSLYLNDVMETLSVLPDFWSENPPVNGRFSSQRPVMDLWQIVELPVIWDTMTVMWRRCVILHDILTGGPGCDIEAWNIICQVKWNPKQRQTEPVFIQFFTPSPPSFLEATARPKPCLLPKKTASGATISPSFDLPSWQPSVFLGAHVLAHNDLIVVCLLVEGSIERG